MPIYGYKCKQCGHELEVLQSISDPPLKTCPECMGPLQKQLYPAGIIFKGSGFYSTDYKGGSKSTTTSSSSDSGNGKSESSSEPAKSESKSESSGSND
jgi:putative FmdB family regulatory protein